MSVEDGTTGGIGRLLRAVNAWWTVGQYLVLSRPLGTGENLVARLVQRVAETGSFGNV